MPKPDTVRDITAGDVKDILKVFKKDGAGAFTAAQEMADMWWGVALAGVHNPPAKDDLRDMILSLLLEPAAPDAVEVVVGDRATEWWCNYMSGAFNPTQDIEARDALALMLVTAAKKAASL
jgi:hypothetical protein